MWWWRCRQTLFFLWSSADHRHTEGSSLQRMRRHYAFLAPYTRPATARRAGTETSSLPLVATQHKRDLPACCCSSPALSTRERAHKQSACNSMRDGSFYRPTDTHTPARRTESSKISQSGCRCHWEGRLGGGRCVLLSPCTRLAGSRLEQGGPIPHPLL